MAIILPFSEISNQVKIKVTSKKVLIDTCALISFSHDTSEFHDETLDLFTVLMKEKFHVYSNVNIRSEFIDHQRRIIITEALTSLSQQVDGILSNRELARRLKSHRANVHKRANAGNSLVLNDSTIKQFKKHLSFGHKNIKNVWLRFCDDNLKGRLEKTFDLISSVLKFKYISLRKEDRSPEVIKDVSWDKMYQISEKSGLSISDSMILNMFKCTAIPFFLTTDFDLVYAAAISTDQRLIFCPERIYVDFQDKFSQTI